MMVQNRGMLLAIIAWTYFQFVTRVKSLATFEMHVMAFSNPTDSIATGQCCQNYVSSTCNSSCLTFFEVCLDDLHLEEPNCMFGKNRSKIFHTSSLTTNETRLERSIPILTSLSWPGIFGLRLSAIDNSTRTSASKGLIQQIIFVDKITPGSTWKTKNESGPISSILFRYRVTCTPHYFGLNCTIYCKPRDDEHGHFGCDVNGSKYCLNGWNDISDYCKKPICNETCKQGSCSGPNICSCSQGWTGPLCSTCQTRVGCVNGNCTVPRTCNCYHGWGGINCDKENDYCGMHKPCQNGGACINNGLGAFRCYCQSTHTGLRCETTITACTVSPCQNGGSCQVVGGGYKCICRPAYTGVQCETQYDPCAFFHCQNNGTCNATDGQPFCNCSKEFTGQRCETILQLTTFQSASTYSTESNSRVIRSILPSDGISFSYSSTVLMTVLSSYQPKITEITPRINVAKSSDIGRVPKTVVRRTQNQGSSRRLMAIGISVAISFLIIMIIGLTLLWVKSSKRRGHHKFRTASTIAPGSAKNACKLLDAVIAQKSSSINTSGLHPSARGESTSSASGTSQAVSSKDINIDSSCLQLHPRIDSKASYLNNCSSYSNFGYLSEGTSGYESENSSARSSANLSNRASKSPVNTNDIIVSRCSTSKGPSGDLPNCIAYLEEYQEVEL